MDRYWKSFDNGCSIIVFDTELTDDSKKGNQGKSKRAGTQSNTVAGRMRGGYWIEPIAYAYNNTFTFNAMVDNTCIQSSVVYGRADASNNNHNHNHNNRNHNNHKSSNSKYYIAALLGFGGLGAFLFMNSDAPKAAFNIDQELVELDKLISDQSCFNAKEKMAYLQKSTVRPAHKLA